MSTEEKYPIRKDWDPYYESLEGIRRTGVCNMFSGWYPLMQMHPELSENDARGILSNWIRNYSELKATHGWIDD
jgi:hypothetical protein